MVICKRIQGVLIFKGIIPLYYSPSLQAYACGVCGCRTTAAAEAKAGATTAAQPQPQPQQAVPSQELLKVTVEVLDLAEQVLEKEQDRLKIGVGKEPNVGLYGGKGHKNVSVSLSGRHKIPLNIFQLKLSRFLNGDFFVTLSSL